MEASRPEHAGDTATSAPRGDLDDMLRQLAPQVLGALARQYGQFETCEDAVQDALLEAATQWPSKGIPDNPRGWLRTVASRRLVDRWRSDRARREREQGVAVMARLDEPAAAEETAYHHDDSLTVLFLCCHPTLSPASQVALTLRAVGGLTTSEIAAAFLVPETTMAQRISRAKQRIRAAGARFVLPEPAEVEDRLVVVLHVLYLIFNEGYTTSAGPQLQRPDLSREAIRLTRDLHRQLPDDGKVSGLLALMLLTDSRRDARTSPEGMLVPLAEQDRRLWHRDQIREGVDLITESLGQGPVASYQLQAAIAAVHAESPGPADTDWAQIVALYDLLAAVDPSPMVTLNRAAAVGMAEGPHAGLEILDLIDGQDANHRFDAVRAHLLEMAGDRSEARARYRRAATTTRSLIEQRYLLARAARLNEASQSASADKARGQG